MHRIVSLAAALMVACSSAPPPRTSSSPAGTGPALSSLDPGAERLARAGAMTGSCSFARPPEKAAEFPTRLRVRGAPGQRVPVRVEPLFRGADQSNVIGRLAPGTTLYGRGPVKYSEASPGLGYAILVRDSAGHVCRGYVRAAAVMVER